jgi:hypothetical protein
VGGFYGNIERNDADKQRCDGTGKGGKVESTAVKQMREEVKELVDEN